MLERANREFDGKLESLGMLGKKTVQVGTENPALGVPVQSRGGEFSAKKHTDGHFSYFLDDLQCVKQ